MKKFLAIIILVFVFIFTGCGESQSYSGDNMFVVVQSNLQINAKSTERAKSATDPLKYLNNGIPHFMEEVTEDDLEESEVL